MKQKTVVDDVSSWADALACLFTSIEKKKDDCSQSVQSVGEQIIISVPWSSVISFKKKG